MRAATPRPAGLRGGACKASRLGDALSRCHGNEGATHGLAVTVRPGKQARRSKSGLGEHSPGIGLAAMAWRKAGHGATGTDQEPGSAGLFL